MLSSDYLDLIWDAIRREDAPNTFLTIEIIRRIFNYQRQMREFILERLDRNTFLDLPDISAGERIIPFARLFNAIENNLRLLVAADITPMMEFTKIWRGGLSDIKFLDYTDVNRWFRTLQLLRDYIMTLTRRHFVAGTFRTGSNRYHQMIGIGRI